MGPINAMEDPTQWLFTDSGLNNRSWIIASREGGKGESFSFLFSLFFSLSLSLSFFLHVSRTTGLATTVSFIFFLIAFDHFDDCWHGEVVSVKTNLRKL